MQKLKRHRRGMLIDRMNTTKKRESKLEWKDKEVLELKQAQWVYRPNANRPKMLNRLSKVKSENDMVAKLFNPKDDDSPLILKVRSTNILRNVVVDKRQSRKHEPKEVITNLLVVNNVPKTHWPNYMLYNEYGDRIMLNMIKDDIISQISSCLDSHPEISKSARARMIDWFIEIVWNFNCHPNTFYLASKILDNYFHKAKSPIKIHELHLLGVTAIFIASKMEDLVPFSLTVVYNKIAHEMLSKQVILKKEQELFQTLDYNIKIATLQNYTSIFLVSFYSGTGHRYYELTSQLIDFISKTAHHDYSLIQTRQNVLSASVVYVSFVILEKLVGKKWITREFMVKLTSFMKVRESHILDTAKILLVLVQNFDTKHRGLNNMKSAQFKVLSKHM
jgi:hypothetical protein